VQQVTQQALEQPPAPPATSIPQAADSGQAEQDGAASSEEDEADLEEERDAKLGLATQDGQHTGRAARREGDGDDQN
jgi:ribosomal protein L12E/L44/L45/RPP1/RPP2